MRYAAKVLLAAVLVALSAHGDAKGHRSHAAVVHFKHAHPCPANGAGAGSCPGYVIDHVKPLCAGGADDPSNMQWQTVADAKRKDVIERNECRAAKR